MEKKISIIIPAYNAAKYLSRCIESTASQDLSPEEYEVIVINDGSTDNTKEILETLCHKYNFLNSISTPNSGLSKTRNRGIENANGEFLLFLDADDSIASNCLGNIYKEMSANELDMMLMNYQYLFPDGTQKKSSYHIDRNTEEVVSGKEFLIKKNHPPMVPLYGYRRSFLKENQLTLLPIGHEDEEFTPRAICLAKRMKYLPLHFYNYFQNGESFMNSYKESNFYDMITAMSSLNKFKSAHHIDSETAAYFESLIANRILMIFKRSIREGYPIQNKLIQKIKQEGLFPLKPQKNSFYTFLFNRSPALFEKYYRLIKSILKQN